MSFDMDYDSTNLNVFQEILITTMTSSGAVNRDNILDIIFSKGSIIAEIECDKENAS